MAYSNNLSFEDGVLLKKVYQVVDTGNAKYRTRPVAEYEKHPFVSYNEFPEKINWLGSGAYVWEKIESAVWWAKKNAKSSQAKQLIYEYELKIEERLLYDLSSDGIAEDLNNLSKAINEACNLLKNSKKINFNHTTPVGQIFDKLPVLLSLQPDAFPERLIRACHTPEPFLHKPNKTRKATFYSKDSIHLGDPRVFQICILEEHLPRCILSGKLIDTQK